MNYVVTIHTTDPENCELDINAFIKILFLIISLLHADRGWVNLKRLQNATIHFSNPESYEFHCNLNTFCHFIFYGFTLHADEDTTST